MFAWATFPLIKSHNQDQERSDARNYDRSTIQFVQNLANNFKLSNTLQAISEWPLNSESNRKVQLIELQLVKVHKHIYKFQPSDSYLFNLHPYLTIWIQVKHPQIMSPKSTQTTF